MIFIILSSLVLSVVAAFLVLFHQVGFSLTLFVTMFLGFFITILKNYGKIKNRKYFLFLIPILLLSSTYFIFNNEFFSFFNYFVILILFNVMAIGVINGNVKINSFFNNFINMLIEPLDNKDKAIGEIKELKIFKSKTKDKLKVIKAIGISVPILALVIFLLSRSEEVFAKFFLNIIKVFNNYNFDQIVFKLIILVVIFLYLILFFYYIVKVYKEEVKEQNIKLIDSKMTFYILFVSLNVIYLIYSILQIKSLGIYFGDDSIPYAEYARSGFFELMIVTFINVIIILLSTRYKEKDKFINITSTIMIGFTYILLASAFIRMYFYELTYGYTMLKLFVYFILITEAIMLILTIIYILKRNIKLLNIYFIIGGTSYTLINFINIDYIIARENVNRYFLKGQIDINYLMEDLSFDAAEEIMRLKDANNIMNKFMFIAKR